MTQLTLFDAQTPALPFDFPVLAPTEILAPKQNREEQTNKGIPLFDPAVGEIHQLGDLARLVLARYDLVAQRKRNLAERMRNSK
jgi:hypothetical protein